MPQSDSYNQFASSFSITELSGDQRILVLRGRALPYRPFSLSGAQRNTVEWYGGNPIGVAQVYGAKEDPTTINGWWKDVFLGLGDFAIPTAAVGKSAYAMVESASRIDVLDSAVKLTELVDDIRRKGSLVQVDWFNIIRIGLISKFGQKWHTGHDVEYEIEFTWISQDVTDLSAIKYVNSIPLSDLTDAPGQLHAMADQLQPGVSGFANGFSRALSSLQGNVFVSGVQDVLDAIDTYSVKIGNALDDFDSAVIQATQFASTPADIQKRIAGVLDGLKLEASALSLLYSSYADAARLNIGGTFGSVLSDRSVQREQGATAGDIAAYAAQQEQKIVMSLTSNVLAIFQARDGDDLRRVSQIYYGTPDDWQALMLYNELDDDQLRAGQLIIVPSAPNQVTA